MTTETVVAPAARVVARELWRIWFDRSLIAIEKGDFGSAKNWLTEAKRHAQVEIPNDDRCGMTLANLAFVNLRYAQELCRKATSNCYSRCEHDQFESQAREEMKLAQAEASAASQQLTNESNDPQWILAKARAFHVLGEGCRLADNYEQARQYLKDSRDCYKKINSQLSSLEEVYARLFEVSYLLGCFADSICYLDKLEGLVSSLPDRRTVTWLARLASARANALLELGRYREAAILHTRWSQLISQETQRLEDPYDRAMEYVTFARTQLILGNYQEASRLIENGSGCLGHLPIHKDWLRACLTCRYCCCPCRDDLLLFDVALLRTELAFAVGDYACCRQLFRHATSLNPTWPDRRIRLALIHGRLAAALGSFKEACDSFTLAKQLCDSMPPCRRPYFVAALRGFARTEGETSDWKAAIAHATQAIQCLEENRETISAEFAWSLHELAIGYIREDRGAEAQPLCERSGLLLDLMLRPGHPDHAPLELTIAEAWIEWQQPMCAIDACIKSRQLYQEFGSRDGFAYARTLRIEAEALQCQHQVECAGRLLECAFACWLAQEELLGCVHPEKSMIWLDIAVNNVSRNLRKEADEVFYSTRDLICQFKGNAGRAGFELNRRGVLLLWCKLFNEADWLFCHAEEFYSECYGPAHEFTLQIRKNREVVERRRKEACAPMPHCCP